MTDPIAIISAGPSRATWEYIADKEKYADVICVTAACFDYEADWFCVLDQCLIDSLHRMGCEPRKGWLTLGCSVPNGIRLEHRFADESGFLCRYSFPLALHWALQRTPLVEIYGNDQSVDTAHSPRRWRNEGRWLKLIKEQNYATTPQTPA